MPGMMGSPAGYKSQGSLSTMAKQATERACQASDNVNDTNPQTHRAAADLHQVAANAHRNAGNDTKAREHQKMARMHGEKADQGDRARFFAQDEARNAEQLSSKAGKAKFGDDPDDPRSEQELHRDAADAHQRAAKAFDMAKMPRDAAYHQAKASGHLKRAG